MKITREHAPLLTALNGWDPFFYMPFSANQDETTVLEDQQEKIAALMAGRTWQRQAKKLIKEQEAAIDQAEALQNDPVAFAKALQSIEEKLNAVMQLVAELHPEDTALVYQKLSEVRSAKRTKTAATGA